VYTFIIWLWQPLSSELTKEGEKGQGYKEDLTSGSKTCYLMSHLKIYSEIVVLGRTKKVTKTHGKQDETLSRHLL